MDEGLRGGNEAPDVGTMTKAEVDEYIARTVAQKLAASGRNDERPSPLGADPTGAGKGLDVADPYSIEAGADVVEPWKRRDVQYFEALRKSFNDKITGPEALAAVAANKPNAAERAAQHAAAVEIVKGAGLPFGVVQRLMSTLAQSAGAGLLSKPFLAEVFVMIEKFSKARQLARWVTMTSDSVDAKSIATKPTWGFVDQNGRIPATGFTLTDDDKLTAVKGGALVPYTRELDEDQAIEFLPILAALFGEAKGKWEDELCFIADGTSTYKSQTGILTAASNVVTMASTKTTFDSVTADDFSKLYNAVSEASKEGAVFGFHSSLWGTIERLKGSDGQYIISNPTDAAKRSMFGYPVQFLDCMPALADTAVSKKFAFFGNPNHVLMGARREFEMGVFEQGVITASDGTVTFSAVENDGVVLRATQRQAVLVPSGVKSAFAVLRTAAS